jgi:hypothetical protein
MMHRLHLPDCTVCGTEGSAFWESSRWPTLRICYDCRDAIVQTFFNEGIDTHVLLSELVGGTSIDESSLSSVFFPVHTDGVRKPWRAWHTHRQVITSNQK